MKDRIRKFISDFETKIVIPGVRHGIFKTRRVVSMSPGKLASTEFGKTIGLVIDSDIPFAIDYYGHVKKSKGLLREARDMEKKLWNKTTIHIPTTLVHFSAVKMPELMRIRSWEGPHVEDFIKNFFIEKENVVKLRWRK